MTPLATRILDRLNRGPATWRMMVDERIHKDHRALLTTIREMAAAKLIESTLCDGVRVWHIPTPISKPSRPRTPRAPRVKKSKLHPGILELMKRQGKV